MTAAERAARAKAIRQSVEAPTVWGVPVDVPPALPLELKQAA